MVVIVAGVSGVGKTTVGRLLASRLGCAFLDADDLHPLENVAKMRGGTPLTDRDRAPWLERVRAAVAVLVERGEDGVVACSALKRSYRDRLRLTAGVRIVLLQADRALLRERLRGRWHPFMPEGLLESQMADLEEPDGTEDVCRVDVRGLPEEAVETIVRDCLGGVGDAEG